MLMQQWEAWSAACWMGCGDVTLAMPLVAQVGGKKRKNALDGIGGGGQMRAGGGGGSYEDYAAGSSRSRVEFQRGRD